MPAGRKAQLTDEIRDAFCKVVEAGNFLYAAAKAIGIPLRTINDWMTKGRRNEKPMFVNFLRAVEKAEAQAELNMVRCVIEQAQTDAVHARWWLEKKFPKRWSPDSRRLKELEKRVELWERMHGLDSGSHRTENPQTNGHTHRETPVV